MSASARRYVCECGTAGCVDVVRLTGPEYGSLQRAALKVISSRHEPDPATVVKRGPGWVAIGRRRRITPPAAAGAIAPGDVVAAAALIRYCSTCETDTLPDDRGHCLWCGRSCVDVEEAAAA